MEKSNKEIICLMFVIISSLVKIALKCSKHVLTLSEPELLSSLIENNNRLEQRMKDFLIEMDNLNELR